MKKLRFCIVVASMACGPFAWAQSPVTSTLLAQRVETVDGKAVLKPAAQSKPGDVIEYSNTFKNGGTAAAEKLLAVVPVPLGTTLMAGTAEPAQAQASSDGVVFAPMPLMRSVRQPDGSQRSEAVPLADYRALRWELGSLAAGRSVAVSLRVKVDAPAVSTPDARPAVRP
jgi:uncharacterized repeat protein (TIGR01451 family)